MVAVNDRSVAYHVIGSGKGVPLVLINGGPGFDHSFLHFSPAWEKLAEARRVVFFDQPGTGQSWRLGPNDSVGVADIVQSIEKIRQAIRAENIALLGHSWGGYAALAYALAHPAKSERLILVSSVAPRISTTEFLWGALFPERIAAEKGLSANNPEDVQKYIRGRLAMSFYSSAARDRVMNRLGRQVYHARQETLLWKDAESRDLSGKLATLSMPVLVTAGRFDANVSPRTAFRIHQSMPKSEFFIWERSGHFPMIEEPSAFVEVVDSFLRSRR